MEQGKHSHSKREQLNNRNEWSNQGKPNLNMAKTGTQGTSHMRELVWGCRATTSIGTDFLCYLQLSLSDVLCSCFLQFPDICIASTASLPLLCALPLRLCVPIKDPQPTTQGLDSYTLFLNLSLRTCKSCILHI